MTELQWALVIIGVAAALGIYFYSRRDGSLRGWRPPGGSDSPLKPKPPSREQMEMFQSSGYDELGVSKPRVINGPRRTPELMPVPGYEEPEQDEPPAPTRPLPTLTATRSAPVAAPAPQPAAVPGPLPLSTPPPAPAEAGAKPVIARYEEKFFALLIAEREGTNIYGNKLHSALQAQRLGFGARQIYHRLEQGMVQFSVASLLQPGTLDPAEAADFSTPGLSIFMVLPGPVRPLAAFDDMVATARSLAMALNGEVFDTQRRPLTLEAVQAMRADVEAWARGQNLG